MSLAISEQFYSIQGEGPTAGVPSVFLRLKGCNLTCGGLHTVQTKATDNGATWRCDTIETWLQGEKVDTKTILHTWNTNRWLIAIEEGAHIVITGGEPLLQQSELIDFLKALEALLGKKPYVEIETNGTIIPTESLAHCISQFNVSPKLTNSGMPREGRLIPEAIHWYAKNKQAYFKFVLNNADDWLEIEEEFLEPFNIAKERVLIMPAASTRKEVITNCQELALLCQRESVRLSPRLQLLFWDRTTGI
jgi:6-pyruvoyltetrahydropterin 2'-reductase